MLKNFAIHHCSILVSDMERASAWYEEVLGLKPIPTPSTFAGVERISRVRWFELSNGQHVHLMPGGPDTRSPRHFAIHIEDAKQAREELRQHGVQVEETTPIPGADRFFIWDPDGNQIEIMQWEIPWPHGDPAPVYPEKAKAHVA